MTSDLIVSAVAATYAEWRREYGALPVTWAVKGFEFWQHIAVGVPMWITIEPVPLTTEIAIIETSKRRSRRHEPGHCYRVAGWREVRRTERGHGRPARCFLEAPPP